MIGVSTLLLASVLGWQQRDPVPVAPVKRVTYECRPCFGSCPVYKVTINKDGTIDYHGIRFVDRIGHYKATVARSKVNKLFDAIRWSNFWDMKDRYELPITDMPTQILTAESGRLCRTVEEYGDSGPEELHKLQERVETVVKAAKHWKKLKS